LYIIKSNSVTEAAFVGRGERIRTSDLSVPNAALYQAEPRPEYDRDTLREEPELSLCIGAEGGSRTHTRLPSTVFETVASAIPPLRHACLEINRQSNL
jgi:hypothetical protein